MEIEYNNLNAHYVITIFGRQFLIPEKNRIRVEKYISWIENNNFSKLYAIYLNREHMHILSSRTATISEEDLATVIADSSEKFINENNPAIGQFKWQQSPSAFSVSKSDVD